MQLYPAIDLKNGQCVRLRQGAFKDITVYSKAGGHPGLGPGKLGKGYRFVQDNEGLRRPAYCVHGYFQGRNAFRAECGGHETADR